MKAASPRAAARLSILHDTSAAVDRPRYYQEPHDVLERCIQSVRDQTVMTDHFSGTTGPRPLRQC